MEAMRSPKALEPNRVPSDPQFKTCNRTELNLSACIGKDVFTQPSVVSGRTGRRDLCRDLWQAPRIGDALAVEIDDGVMDGLVEGGYVCRRSGGRGDGR